MAAKSGIVNFIYRQEFLVEDKAERRMCLPSGQTDALGKDVMFIRLRLLGDIIFTIPSVELFKNRFPDLRIHYVVEDRFQEIAALIPGIERVITVPRRRRVKDILAFRRTARELGIRTVIDFHSGPGSAVLTLASGAACRVGYRTPNRNWAYNHLVDRHVSMGPAHSVNNQARLLQAVGISTDSPPHYPVMNAKPFPLSSRLAEARDLRPRVVIHLGAGNRFRDWGEDHFTGLVQRLSSRKLPVLLVGGSPQEQARAARLREFPHTKDFSGPMSTGELLALIAGAAAYVGADSGPLHLASLTATPLVALFGPNLPAISGPWRKENVEIIQLGMACRPCSQRRCKYGTIPCMRNISVDKVHEAISKFIP
jgi:ADP-heptose:LPS heptosyltransferase